MLSGATFPTTDRASPVERIARIARLVEDSGARNEALGVLAPEVVDSLQRDVVLPYTTELICQVHPGHPTPGQIVTALERIAKEVAPALGWRNSV